MQIWDLGGQQNLRPVWVTYYKNTSAVIMVVDSTDRVRVGITKVWDFWDCAEHVVILTWELLD